MISTTSQMYVTQSDSPIQFLPGVGPKRAALLQSELGVATIGDLVRVYPFRYIDRSSVQRIADVPLDAAYVQIQAKVVRTMLLGKGGQVIYSRDENGALRADGTIPGYGAIPTEADTRAAKSINFSTAKRLSVIVDDTSGTM